MQQKEPEQGLRVLLLEDVPTDAELVEEELRSAGIEFLSAQVDNQNSFLEALDRFSPEIILADYSLPAFDGESALLLARQKAPGVPFIFVTGALGEDRAVDLLKRGATDFVLKDRLDRLPLCVKRALEEIEAQQRRRHAEEELQRAHDQLEQEVEKRTAELRQRTRELQQLTETLEQRVAERTEALGRANESLRRLSAKLLSAHESERKRIAGEVHDSLGSCFSAIRFKVEEALRKNSETGPSRLTEAFNVVLPLIQDGMDECRRIQTDLRPSVLDDLGILATFSWLCRRYESIYSNIRIAREISVKEDEVPEELKIVIFRIAQEAMNNVAKHSKADRIGISLQKTGDLLELAIVDNGDGFDLQRLLSTEQSRKGMGLSSMRERTEISGGGFDIQSAKGKGTTIRASWPLHDAEHYRS